jgi:ATP-dependent exoDNAse (exonuclease V) beta subunit
MFQNEVCIFWETVIEFSENSLNLFDFIEYMGNLKKTLKIDVDGIRISTIHGSKGTEAKIVFLFDSGISLIRNNDLNLVNNKVFLTYSNSKLYKITRNNELLNQELEGDRLMYVALTRSKEQLYVIPPISSDKIAPKSIYASIIQEIGSFNKISEFEYELTDLEKHDSVRAIKIK